MFRFLQLAIFWMSNIFVISQPRSGSSMLANLIGSAGYVSYTAKNSILLSPSTQNKSGYFEDIKLMLLNDQLIRSLYGSDFSFLYPPSNESRKFNHSNYEDNIPEDFFYDIFEETLYLPDNFKDDPSKYTGMSWDVWGLTRMLPGKKWYKCYSNFGVCSKNEMFIAKKEIESDINNSTNYVIKDPRFSLTMELYNFSEFENNKFIFLTRSHNSVINSMRKHYGPKMFSESYLKNTNYVSNHFNHKIGYMSYDNFNNRYNFLKNSWHKDNWIEIAYEKIINKDSQELKKLENFLGSKIDKLIISS